MYCWFPINSKTRNKQEKSNFFSLELLRWGLRATRGEET